MFHCLALKVAAVGGLGTDDSGREIILSSSSHGSTSPNKNALSEGFSPAVSVPLWRGSCCSCIYNQAAAGAGPWLLLRDICAFLISG